MVGVKVGVAVGGKVGVAVVCVRSGVSVIVGVRLGVSVGAGVRVMAGGVSSTHNGLIW